MQTGASAGRRRTTTVPAPRAARARGGFNSRTLMPSRPRCWVSYEGGEGGSVRPTDCGLVFPDHGRDARRPRKLSGVPKKTGVLVRVQTPVFRGRLRGAARNAHRSERCAGSSRRPVQTLRAGGRIDCDSLLLSDFLRHRVLRNPQSIRSSPSWTQLAKVHADTSCVDGAV